MGAIPSRFLSSAWVAGALIFAFIPALAPALAAGGKRTSASPGAALPYEFANPLRPVVLLPIRGVQAFQTPNQVVTSLHAELREMAKAVIVPNSRFAPVEDTSQIAPREGDTFVSLEVAVTNFTLEATEIGVSFGYNNDQIIPVLGGVQIGAEGKIHIGSIRMAFLLYRCVRRGAGDFCEPVASSESTQKVLGTNLDFGIKYGQIKLGVDLMTRTDLGEKLRKIMLSGVTQLAADPRVRILPWSVPVTHVGVQPGSFWISAGVESYLTPSQSFVIYESALAAGLPEVFHPLACAHTTNDVFDGASRIQVDRIIEAGGAERIRPGNVVKVGTPGCAQ